jgi:manganese/zinc/iron transport system ATP- binding protein
MITCKETIALDIQHLTVAYRGSPVVWDLSVAIPAGKLLAVVGPNGAGKTTLLKAILGLITPLAGTISIFGKPAQNARNKIAYVPQRMSVDWDFPVTVLDVVLMGCYARLGWFRRPGKQDKFDALEFLAQVDMAVFADTHISELSGGQQQRVFLARALMQRAEIYIMDEPFAGVDIVSEKAIVQVLKGLRLAGRTVVVVHHDIQTLTEYFDWIILMNVRTIACGPVEEVLKPEFMCRAYGNRTIYQPYS